MNSWGPWKKCSPDMMNPGRFALLLLILALVWQTPAPAIAQAACGAFAVATAPQTSGSPLSDNVVELVAPDGVITAGMFEEPRTVEPSPKPDVALVRSLGGIIGLMDVVSGKVTPLQIPEDEQRTLTSSYPTIRNAAESDFMLLSEMPNAVWLVDLSSGDALDLTTLNYSGSNFVDSAEISPNGQWLLYFAKDQGFLISLETPGDPSPIDTDPLLPFPSFDETGKVVYAVQAPLLVSIRSLDPATGVRTELTATTSGRVLPLHLSSQLLMFDERKLLQFELGVSTPTTVFDWVDGPAAVLANVSGTHLLVSDYRADVTKWFWVEVATGTSVELSELQDMAPIGPSATGDAVLFMPGERIGPGVPGAQYRTVDLNTGEIVTPLEQDSTDVYQARAAGDADGRYSIVNAVSPGSGRIWLIDNQAGAAVQIATSSGNADALVSPDGCQLAVAIYDTDGEGRTSMVTVTSMVDGSTLMMVSDALLLGWAEISSKN